MLYYCPQSPIERVRVVLERYNLKEGVDFSIHNNVIVCHDAKYEMILMVYFGKKVSREQFEL